MEKMELDRDRIGIEGHDPRQGNFVHGVGLVLAASSEWSDGVREGGEQ